MLQEYPPSMNAYGIMGKILERIKEAKTPERFTQDYLSTKLKFGGGSAKAFIPLSKRLGLLGSDGTPTNLYKKYRNPASSKAAMAEAIKNGYADLFERNEYVYNLDSAELEGLIVEATGLEKGSGTLNAIVKTFEALKGLADFEAKEDLDLEGEGREKPPVPPLPPGDGEEVTWNLSYTINLVLPKSENINVFNAIFKSLKENLLRK